MSIKKLDDLTPRKASDRSASIEISQGSISFIMKATRHLQILSKEEEAELARQGQAGNLNAFQLLVLHNVRYFIQVAREYQGLGLSVDDLVNEAMLGAMEAATRFNPSIHNNKFTTYAVWWVRKQIKITLSEKVETIRVPVGQRIRLASLRQYERSLLQELESNPKSEDLAARLEKVSLKISNLLQLAHRKVVQLEEPIHGHEDDFKIGDTLAGPKLNEQVTVIEEQDADREINEGLKKLSPRQRFVLQHRFGLKGNATYTYAEIARALNVTRESVRQIEAAAKPLLARAIVQMRAKKRNEREKERAIQAQKEKEQALLEASQELKKKREQETAEWNKRFLKGNATSTPKGTFDDIY